MAASTGTCTRVLHEVTNLDIRLIKAEAESAVYHVNLSRREEKLTTQTIAVITHKFRPLYGTRQAKRDLRADASGLRQHGNQCPDCQRRLEAAAAAL